jgi:hypothetical protein
MTSDKQIRANRRNARKSAGPKTPHGKAAVRLNAIKHGLLSGQILLPNEDEASLMKLSEHLHSQLLPVGELESILVDRIVAATWRLRRVLAVEAGVYEEQRFGFMGDEHGLGGAFIQDANGANAFSKLSRYETTIRAWSLQRLARTPTPAGRSPRRSQRRAAADRGRGRIWGFQG